MKTLLFNGKLWFFADNLPKTEDEEEKSAPMPKEKRVQAKEFILTYFYKNDIDSEQISRDDYREFLSQLESRINDPASPSTYPNFFIGQEERCPETGRLHFQGFVQFSKRRGALTIREFFQKAWVRVCSNDYDYAAAYSEKVESRVDDSVRWRAGIFRPSQQGRRTDIRHVTDKIRDGIPILECIRDSEDVFVKYSTGFLRLHSMLRSDGELPAVREVIYFWGAPGTGKTYQAHLYGGVSEDKTFTLMQPHSGSVWWDGVAECEKVCIDEYGSGWIDFNLLMQLCDPKPRRFRVPTKGSTAVVTAKTICITSNIRPEQLHTKIKNRTERLQGLRRRISKIYHCERRVDLGFGYQVTEMDWDEEWERVE